MRVVALSCALLATTAAAPVRADGPVAAAPAQANAQPLVDVTTLRLRVEPARVVVGETAEAWVTVEARDVRGAPFEVGPPALTASTGRIEAPQRAGVGVYRARFVPPAEAYPHVALVSAVGRVGDAAAVGFVVVPLWGRGQTTVKTKPRSQVTVRVGAAAFGPIVAGDDGAAVVPLLVPPGPERAIASSVDGLGNESQKTVDLGVPAFNRLAVRVLDDVVVAGRPARLLAFVVDRKGAPVTEARLTVAGDIGPDGRAAGRLDGAPRALAPGVFELRWVPGARAATTSTSAVVVQLADASLSRARASLTVVGEPPARAELALPRRTLGADDAREVALDVTVLGASGARLPVGAVVVDAAPGFIELRPGSDGTPTPTWVVPAKTPATTGTLRVRSRDNGAVLAEATLVLTAGRLARLAIAPMSDVVADGRSGVFVVVTAADAAGNEVAPAGVVITSADGRVFAPHVDASGRRLEATFVPDPVADPAVATVEARAGDVRATQSVRLAPRPRPRLLVSGGVGVSQSGDVGAVGPEVSLLLRVPVLDGSLYAGLESGLLFGVPALSARSFDEHRALPVFAAVAWRPLIVDDVGLHVGVATGVLGVDAVDAGAYAIAPTFGTALTIGAFWNVGPGSVDIAGRLRWALTPALDNGFAGVPIGPGVVVGYRFSL